MTRWQRLLDRGDVKLHDTSQQELDNMRALIARDLQDATLPRLSSDRRFATAYNAALQAAGMAVACAGYRTTARTGHHHATLDAASIALGHEAEEFTDYFDLCRRKRNVIDYMTASVATATESDELLERSKLFYEFVERWISVHHPQWGRGARRKPR